MGVAVGCVNIAATPPVSPAITAMLLRGLRRAAAATGMRRQATAAAASTSHGWAPTPPLPPPALPATGAARSQQVRGQSTTASSSSSSSSSPWLGAALLASAAGASAAAYASLVAEQPQQCAPAAADDQRQWDPGLDPTPIRRVLTKRPYVYHEVDASVREMMRNNVVMVSGSTHPELSSEIAHFLGVELSSMNVSTFADGETAVQINVNCRGKDVFVVQSLCGQADGKTINDAVIELMLTISAARRASAERITAVIPYFAYARQSRKGTTKSRTTIAAGDIAKMLHTVGVDRVLTVDLHSPEIVGCFPNTVNLINVVPTPVAAAYFGEKEDLVNPCVVSPKSGGLFRAKQFRQSLSRFTDAELVTFVKEKFSDGSTTRRLLGDVAGKDCILVDDMMDTGTTIIRAAQRLKRAGARRVFVYVSHGLFSGTAWASVVKSEAIDEVIVSNTIPAGKHSGAAQQDKIRQLSLAPLLAEAMSRCVTERSTRVLTKQ